MSGYLGLPEPPDGWQVKCLCGWWSFSRDAGPAHAREHRVAVIYAHSPASRGAGASDRHVPREHARQRSTVPVQAAAKAASRSGGNVR